MTSAEDEHESDRTITVRRPVAQAPAPVIGHFLTISEGDQTRRVRINAEGVVIGRLPPSTLVIASPEISRRHCRIDLDEEWAVIIDLNSTNGTFVNEERIQQPTRLRSAARISMGSFSIQYERRDPNSVEREEELTADLIRAAGYVRAILPDPITDGPVRAAWWFEPSSQLGGDAFGYQFLDDQHFAGFLLDVSGHGIGSALHAANVANVLRRRGLPDVDFRQPGKVIAALNTMFPMEEHNELMLTLWYFVYDLTSRTLRYSAAGHHEALLVSGDASDVTTLSARGPTIGMLPTGRWAEGTVQIPAGGRLYVFSDGAFEIVDGLGQEWTIDTLRTIIEAPMIADVPEPERVWRAIRSAARPGPLEDDVSVLVLTFP
jgi:serine phosphatase RsbU (regulator of sigma subunit)